MKKLILIILGSLLALTFIGAVVATLFLGVIVTKGFNTFAPKIIGTTVTLDSASISPLSGSGTLNGLFVGNPLGWQSDKAFSFGKVHVSISPTSLLGSHIVFNEVLIDSPAFVYETKAIASNIKDMLNNIEKKIGLFSSASPGEAAAAAEGGAFKLAIRNFRLENGTVLHGVGPNAITVPLPSLVLTGIGVSEGGITPNQLVATIMTAVLANITKAVADSTPQVGEPTGDTSTDSAAEAVEKTTDGS